MRDRRTGAWHHRLVPPINELTRIEPVHLERLDHQGIFTTGLLLEVSETPTRRQTLADQVDATTNDVLMWRDEALMLNLASFGPAEHQLLIQAGHRGAAPDPRPPGGPVPRTAAYRRDRAEGGPAVRPDDGGLVGPGEDARGRVSGPDGLGLGGERPRRPSRRPSSLASLPPSSSSRWRSCRS